MCEGDVVSEIIALNHRNTKKNWERRGKWNSSWHLKCLFIMLGVKKKQMFFVLLTGADISERFSYMFVKSFITKWVGHDKEVCVAQTLLCLFVQEDCVNFTFLKQFLLPPILFYVLHTTRVVMSILCEQSLLDKKRSIGPQWCICISVESIKSFPTLFCHTKLHLVV